MRGPSLARPRSDALVSFGAIGDLVYNKIFPALQRWNGGPSLGACDRIREVGLNDRAVSGARESVEKHEGLDEAVFTKLQEWLHYISGEYAALRKNSAALRCTISQSLLVCSRGWSSGHSGCARGVFLIQRAKGYGVYQQDLGRAILLGLEFLIPDDIRRTVRVAPTLQNVLVLEFIVLIRRFQSLFGSELLVILTDAVVRTKPQSGEEGKRAICGPTAQKKGEHGLGAHAGMQTA